MRNPVDSPEFDAFAQPEGGLAVMNAVKQMVEAGQAPLPYKEMIEPVAVTEAGRKAHNKAKPVPVAELR